MHVHNIKSKDARRALRRWGFSATITHPGGEATGQNMPGVVYGNHVEALSVADRMKEIFLKQNPEVTVLIEPIPYETVSIETKRQFEGLNDYGSLIAKAAFILADKYKMSIGIIDKDVAQIVNEAVEEARQFLFPRNEQAKAKMQALEDGLGEDTHMVDEPIPVEPEHKDRKRGIEAVREALEGSVPDQESIVQLENAA